MDEEKFEEVTALLKLERLRKDFAGGDSLAFKEALDVCRRFKMPLPEWIQDEILSPSPKQAGRHANPAEQRLDLDSWRIKIAAIRACEYAGLRGEKKLQKARELIKKATGETYSISTLEEAKKRAPKNLRLRFLDFAFFEKELGIIGEDDAVIDLTHWTPPRGRPRKNRG